MGRRKFTRESKLEGCDAPRGQVQDHHESEATDAPEREQL